MRTKYPDAGWRKYLDFEEYVPFTIGVCRRLELPGAAPLRILDIGCGTGLFLYCARHFGHDAVGIDIENELMAEMAERFDVDRRIAPVRPFAPIGIDGSFDLITCMGTQFDRVRTEQGRQKWGCEEWHFFLADLERHLSPTGRLFLRINRGVEARLQRRYFYNEDVHAALLHGYQRNIEYLFDRQGVARACENLQASIGRPVRPATG